MKRLPQSKGVTLTEALVAIAVLGMVFGLVKMGTDWMAALGRQRVLLNAQWNAQVTLYEITRQVRNCQRIVTISSGTLELSVFRPAETGGWSNPNFVVTRTTGTLIYQFGQTGAETFLRRSYTFPDPAFAEASGRTLTRESKLLVNVMEPPLSDMWMFRFYGIDQPGAYEAVEIVIRLRPSSYWKKTQYAKPIEYRTISMKRTSSR